MESGTQLGRKRFHLKGLERLVLEERERVRIEKKVKELCRLSENYLEQEDKKKSEQ